MQPYIIPTIKRVKKHAGDERHGGMWKVAYADFVTAMMAFFLLLWLMNVTTPQQKEGLAEYFTPTIGLKDSMGIGFKGGQTPSVLPGRAVRDLAAPGIVLGQMAQGPVPDTPDSPSASDDPNAELSAPGKEAKKVQAENADEQTFKTASQEIRQQLENDLEAYKNNIVVQDTPEGLKIDMIDDEKKPMFLPASATLTDMGKKILDSMANIISKTPNNITINGHTATGGAMSNPQYTNWELSSDRAQAARRALITTQLQRRRVVRISGFADLDPLTPDDTASPRNNRITIVLMRGSYYRDPHVSPEARDLISAVDSTAKKHTPAKAAAP